MATQLCGGTTELLVFPPLRQENRVYTSGLTRRRLQRPGA